MTPEPEPTEDLSAVYARNDWVRPQVSQPNSPWTVVLGFAGVAVIGAMVFTSLSSARARTSDHASKVTPAAAPAWAPQLQTLMAQNTTAPPPAMAAQAPVSAPALLPSNNTAPASPPDPSENHWRAPAVVVDLSESGGVFGARRIPPRPGPGARGPRRSSP